MSADFNEATYPPTWETTDGGTRRPMIIGGLTKEHAHCWAALFYQLDMYCALRVRQHDVSRTEALFALQIVRACIVEKCPALAPALAPEDTIAAVTDDAWDQEKDRDFLARLRNHKPTTEAEWNASFAWHCRRSPNGGVA